jgi:hypothetical protein
MSIISALMGARFLYEFYKTDNLDHAILAIIFIQFAYTYSNYKKLREK